MKKTFFIILSMFFMFYFMLSIGVQFFIEKSLFYNSGFKMFSMSMILSLDLESMFFIFMVSLVTSMICLYSELYMEHYNNKKFFSLMVAFFFSMVILSLSGSAMILMIGWDGLGLSSLFLIMFYPGKIPLYNSMMTFFYNRMGDCFLMMSICVMLNNSSLFFPIIQELDLNFIIILLMFCSFTKSAQFPLSSWLPAAMSAPTPISAMVHSSTLVTAGVFLLYKFIFFLSNLGLMMFLFIFSCATFLIGGLLGCLEADLKKIVAFSTMSQISMMILFLSLGVIFISITHMIFHALFKTLLFCSCGVAFLSIFSDQLSKIFLPPLNSLILLSTLLVSSFCMSGFPFSSSFFSKDILIEKFLLENSSFIFLLLILGSILTIFYSSKIFSLISTTFYQTSLYFVKKKVLFKFLLLFSSSTLIFPFILEVLLPPSLHPVAMAQDLGLILMLLLTPLLIKFNPLKKFLLILPLDLMFSKFYFFGSFGKMIFIDSFSTHFNDHLVFKPSFFLNFAPIFVSTLKSVVLMFLFMLIHFLWC